jgi:5-methylcytosine-specific restriction endonuclease McrA
MKSCSVEGCNNPVWGKGLCSKHSPRTSLTKNTTIPYIKKEKVEKVSMLVARNRLFMSIWEKRIHRCQHCGDSLGSEPRSYMFDHILEKSKYPQLSLEEENIWMVCMSCHDNKTRGIISEKYQEKINFVTTKFNVS